MAIFKFIVAFFNWMVSGFEIRNPLTIYYIFHSRCKPCPRFQPGRDGEGSCGICGCRLADQGVLLNKIAWKSEKCPDNPPRWGGGKRKWGALIIWIFIILCFILVRLIIF